MMANDFNGLGIQIEERQPVKDDILLPPLPTESSLQSLNSLINNEMISNINSSNPNSNTNSPKSNLSKSNSFVDQIDNHTINERSNSVINSTLEEITSDGMMSPTVEEKIFINANNSFSTYELDSPSINLDSNQLFPTISKTLSNHSNNSEREKSSPLKRLKKTIRKLSLSKNSQTNNLTSTFSNSTTGNSTNTSTPVLGFELHSSNSSNPFSTNSTTINSVITSHNSDKVRPQLSPLQNSHIKTLSQDSNNSKNSLDSKLKCSTPSTPPLTIFSSPVFTISDNVNNNSNIEKIEKDYLANCNIKLEELESKSENLINYYNYLVNEKNHINDSYKITKSRLVKSGWCSNEDLNNLTLQKNFQLNQIDLRLIEINDKISKD
ncbi:hypothetical protein CLIB1444_01S03620 [[Candida] jaroonii]|uniref:Uncharacterized protein n=1 Tax=[Candida] jaroonii TaxID=467808 RepID=A0ACA9Y085_9ASCO|nr:hypothetical protein CLIB1444_01S03620 [[Candida] jaroonii]